MMKGTFVLRCIIDISETNHPNMHAFLKGGTTKVKENDSQALDSASTSTGKEKTKRRPPQPWVEK